MLTFVSKSAHVCDPVPTIVTDEPLSAADARVNRTTPLLTNVSKAARLERGDVSKFFQVRSTSFRFTVLHWRVRKKQRLQVAN